MVVFPCDLSRHTGRHGSLGRTSSCEVHADRRADLPAISVLLLSCLPSSLAGTPGTRMILCALTPIQSLGYENKMQ